MIKPEDNPGDHLSSSFGTHQFSTGVPTFSSLGRRNRSDKQKIRRRDSFRSGKTPKTPTKESKFSFENIPVPANAGRVNLQNRDKRQPVVGGQIGYRTETTEKGRNFKLTKA